MYAYVNGGAITALSGLPFRIRLADGTTRTSLHEMDAATLAEYGYYAYDDAPPEYDATTQKLVGPTLSFDGTAVTASYEVVDKTIEEMAEELDAAKAVKSAELAASRWQAEVSGVNGIRTDRESQALITGAALKAMQDSEYTCKWKTETGFVEMAATQILAIADAVRAHVQTCFDRESELLVMVDAATTPEALEGITWSMQLPS